MPASITPSGTLVDDSLDDDIVFADENEAAETTTGPAWRILVVDDDADVHSTTKFALDRVLMQGRPLSFLHAYSAAEAFAILARETDIAVVLLDVVMERADAGLHLVRRIRDELQLHAVRIVLRTGQPGYAPELDAIRGYDINDYRTKSEMTRTRLYTTVAAAIRSFEQIGALNASRVGMECIVTASAELMAMHGIREVASGVLAQTAKLLGTAPDGVLCTRDPGSGILRAVGAAGSCAHLAGHELGGDLGLQFALAIERTLHARQCRVEDGLINMYFEGKAGRDFAACIPVQRPVSELEHRLLKLFCGMVTISLDNCELVTHLNHAAFSDSLTGLPNRTRMVELIDLILAGNERQHTVLALVDLDHFAETNDALGHLFGDLLLLAVGQRLRSRLPGSLNIARISGDIFGLIGPEADVEPATIQALFDEPFSIEGQDLQVSATLGLVRLLDHDGSGADALKDADIALKRTKMRQRGGASYFSRSMGVEIRERVRMMHALRSGFRRNELYLHYQPQVDLATNRPCGAEALLRWRQEDGRSVAPDRFIPIAESSGMIIEIGAWVLHQALGELMRLRQAGHCDITMSVNVSQVQFRHPHFLDMLKRALHDSGAPPQFVELEITESMAMEEPAVLIKKLAEIKSTGVAIAIDDFGTGFSSLSHLQKLQVDRLKIDRSFVAEITDTAPGTIAEMIVQLGRNLGLTVVAEGVEDERQAHTLRQLGCPLAQGYLFARPLSPEDLLAWLDAQRTITQAA